MVVVVVAADVAVPDLHVFISFWRGEREEREERERRERRERGERGVLNAFLRRRGNHFQVREKKGHKLCAEEREREHRLTPRLRLGR